LTIFSTLATLEIVNYSVKMPKIAKILLALIIVFILAAAFAITWSLYFDKSEDNSNQNQEPQKIAQVKNKKGFKFAVCGDPHSNWKVYEKVLKSAQKKKAEFLINVGDLTRVGAESEYYEGKKLMSEYGYDQYLVIGGHDLTGDGEKWYRKYFGKDYQSWDAGEAHFVVLNNADQKEGISEEQLKWLDEDLMRNDQPLVFIFVHQPIDFPYASPETVGYLTAQSQEREQELAALLKRHKVDAVFAGHLHSYLTYQIEDISAIITGGAGGPLYSLPFLEKTPYHYVLVTVAGNQFDWEMIKVE
jgi:predicted phosphodiesterase